MFDIENKKMKIDDLFQPDVHSASEKLSSETSVVPATDSEDWVSYYKMTHNFYSYWCFKAVYKRRDDIVISEHIDNYLLETVKERIESMLSIYCPLHSDVRVAFQDVDDKMLLLEKHRFNVLFSGDDWKGSERYIKTEEQFVKHICF
jgi:hypothetical protein